MKLSTIVHLACFIALATLSLAFPASATPADAVHTFTVAGFHDPSGDPLHLQALTAPAEGQELLGTAFTPEPLIGLSTMAPKSAVAANHGWPVDVSFVAVDDWPGALPAGTGTKVAGVDSGNAFDAYASSACDVLNHEVQKAEYAAESELPQPA